MWLLIRKVFIEKLPTKIYKNRESIDWIKSIGITVGFEYDNVIGEVLITDYDKKHRRLYFEYNGLPFNIRPERFLNCNLGNILKACEFNTSSPLFIDQIIKTKTGEIKVLEILKNSMIKYECMLDGYISTISKYDVLKRGNGCSVCSNHKILKGINDLATTEPWMIPYIKDIEDCYTHTRKSNKKVITKCPVCGYEKEMSLNKLFTKGFSCPKCSDGISFPNKFIANMLSYINIEFVPEYPLGKFRYDFYLPKFNCIIEAHGEQHYKKSAYHTFSGKSLEHEQLNDKIKETFAKENSIEHYFQIDCRSSNYEWISKSIYDSQLLSLLNLTTENIDWKLCQKLSLNSKTKQSWDLWNSGIHSTVKIGELLNLSRNTIVKYLKKGNDLNMCNYSEKLCKSYSKNK